MEKVNELFKKEITLDLIKNSFKKNIVDKYLVEIVLIINILYILVGDYMLMQKYIGYSNLANRQILLMFFNIAISMFMLAKNRADKQKKTTYIFMFLSFLTGILSVINARISKIAMLGTLNRNEGLCAVAYYFSLMLLATMVNKNTRKMIINIIILTGIVQAIYGILQAFKLPFVVNPIPGIAHGFISNQNFFGTLMLLCLSFSIGLFIEEEKKIKKIVYILESIILTTSLLMSYTTSVVVGLAAVLIFLGIYCIRKKKILNFIIVICAITLTTIITNNLGKTNVVKDIQKVSHETAEIAKGNSDDSFGSGRIFIWKETLKIIPKYFLKRRRIR